ncbi:hypothetical protein IFM89_024913 [Coptis chinensis]|uniref:Uncharacterized protein n=1 Tax=Coptis chinensis TaxID=261450 RepID=A0A835IZS7_9MAGN|nr:hypothetical protein IFM89_024913 [Coptis chinensis]
MLSFIFFLRDLSFSGRLVSCVMPRIAIKKFFLTHDSMKPHFRASLHLSVSESGLVEARDLVGTGKVRLERYFFVFHPLRANSDDFEPKEKLKAFLLQLVDIQRFSLGHSFANTILLGTPFYDTRYPQGVPLPVCQSVGCYYKEMDDTVPSDPKELYELDMVNMLKAKVGD